MMPLSGLSTGRLTSRPVNRQMGNGHLQGIEHVEVLGLTPVTTLIIRLILDFTLSECDRLGIPVPQYMREWIDLKKSYSLATGRWSRSLMTMLDDLKLQPKGRAHSGIDDCGNMARIMETLSTKKKFVYQITSSLEQINKLKPLKT
jgi:hypothetical protein